jgi:hypothetical protein
MRRCTAVIVTVVAGTGIAACSSDGGTESSAATSSAADPCASADALRGSLTALGDVQVVEDGTEALQEAWTTVQDDWAALRDDAGDRYADQVDGVEAAADDVRSALDSAQDDASAQTLADVAASVGVFLQQADDLVTEVGSTC